MKQPEEMNSPLKIPPSRKVFIETWGCQMNVADSERMLGQLMRHQFTATNSPDDADLILLNTCNIREKARHKLLSRLGKLKEYKKLNPSLKIAVTGCISEMEGNDLKKRESTIDLVIGPGKTDHLIEFFEKSSTTGEAIVSTGFEDQKEELDLKEYVNPSLDGKNDISRYVNIIQGCENYCTFCVVPFARGKEHSRSEDGDYFRDQRLTFTGG